MLKLNITQNRVYSVVLPLESGGRALRMELVYNRFGDFWGMSLYDSVEDEYIVSHIPLLMVQGESLVCGVLKQMQYLGLGDFVVLMKERGADVKNPSYWSLSEDFDLFWGET